MRPAASTYAEQWLDERVLDQNSSAKDVADRIVVDAKVQGIAAEDFDDDEGRLFAMIVARIDNR